MDHEGDFIGSLVLDHAPPAYNVILFDGEDTVVHHHEFMDVSRLPADQERYTIAP